MMSTVSFYTRKNKTKIYIIGIYTKGTEKTYDNAVNHV